MEKRSILLVDDDDDIEVVRNNNAGSASFKCPISTLWMENAVRNKVCGHHYSREGITQHMQTMRNKASCPITGCNNQNVTKSQLEDDPEMSARVKRQRRREQREEEVKMSQALDCDEEEDEF